METLFMENRHAKYHLAKVSIALLILLSVSCTTAEKPETEELYRKAMEDSVFACEEEIRPLVTIDPSSDMTSWDENGEKVLMLSWHKDMENYEENTTVRVSGDPIWTFTDKEIVSWYGSHRNEMDDWRLRLEQLIGLPEDSGYTSFSAFWCDPDELRRPAYEPDITEQVGKEDIDGSALGDLEQWFYGNILYSCFISAYPWTRLGYTYDWSGSGDSYGLSEFIILPSSEIEVEWTMTNEEFLSWLEENV